MENKIVKAVSYSEHYVDFSMVGKNVSADIYCVQFISNKPTPYIDETTDEDGDSNIQLSVSGLLHHECTIYIGKSQLEELYDKLSDALGKNKAEQL